MDHKRERRTPPLAKVMRVGRQQQLITIVIPGVVLYSVYKPPNDQCELLVLGYRNCPYIVSRYFSSHITSWGYDTTYKNGEAFGQWADSCDFIRMHGVKLPKYINSARWEKD